MSNAPDRLGTLQLIIDTLKRVDEDPVMRVAEIRGILSGDANHDPELATLLQSLPPLEAEYAHLPHARLRRDRELASGIADVKAELPALRTDVEDVLAENQRLRTVLSALASEPHAGLHEDDMGYWCLYCFVGPHPDADVVAQRHLSECPIVQARALLAKEADDATPV